MDFKIDPVTGASFEELREMTPAQKLAREEKMRENIEVGLRSSPCCLGLRLAWQRYQNDCM